MCLKDLIGVINSRGFDFNIPFIYRQGIKNGFLIKMRDTGKDRYDINETKLMEWLDKCKIDDNWMLLTKAAVHYQIPYSGLKYLIKKNNIETQKMGVNRFGGVCAKREDLDRIVKQYHKRP